MVVEESGKGNYIIVLDDVFDFKRAEEFRNCYESIDSEKCKLVSVDFSHTRYMDSSALGLLINIKTFFKSSSISVKIISVNEQIRNIFTISRFDQHFIIE
jgi:anti-anti-sigma factor